MMLILCLSSLAKTDMDKLRHYFLMLSTDDNEFTDQREATFKKLTKGKADAVAISLEYLNRKSQAKSETAEKVILALGDHAVKPLTHMLTQPDENQAAFAAYLLGRIGSKTSAVPLILASKSSGKRLRAAALGALGSCGDTLALITLTDALADPDPTIRRTAATSLGKIRSKSAMPKLIPLLRDESAFVRYAASYAIAAIGDKAAPSLLSARLSEEAVGEIERFHLIETIGMLGHQESLPMLFEFLEDPSHLVRGFSCQALGYFRGNFEVANALKRCKNDSSGFVRMMAEQALANIRNE